MKQPIDLPPGFVAVPIPKAVLLLTYDEYVPAIRRAKWWRRQATLAREATSTASAVLASREASAPAV